MTVTYRVPLTCEILHLLQVQVHVVQARLQLLQVALDGGQHRSSKIPRDNGRLGSVRGKDGAGPFRQEVWLPLGIAGIARHPGIEVLLGLLSLDLRQL